MAEWLHGSPDQQLEEIGRRPERLRKEPFPVIGARPWHSATLRSSRGKTGVTGIEADRADQRIKKREDRTKMTSAPGLEDHFH